MEPLFLIIGLMMMMLGATLWLFVTFLGKNQVSLKERIK
jgi:hypothetical protein